MASALLLGGQPGEALPYLESIAEVCGVGEDDSLSWNLGAARAACGQWAAAAEALQAVQVRGRADSWLVAVLFMCPLLSCADLLMGMLPAPETCPGLP